MIGEGELPERGTYVEKALNNQFEMDKDSLRGRIEEMATNDPTLRNLSKAELENILNEQIFKMQLFRLSPEEEAELETTVANQDAREKRDDHVNKIKSAIIKEILTPRN